MTLVEPNFSVNKAIAPPQREAVVVVRQSQLNYIYDELVSLNNRMDEALAESKAHDNRPIRSPWADVTQFFATCWRCITSVFRRNH